jgi:hypothetical protein
MKSKFLILKLLVLNFIENWKFQIENYYSYLSAFNADIFLARSAG